MTLHMAMDSLATGTFWDEYSNTWVTLVNGHRVRRRAKK